MENLTEEEKKILRIGAKICRSENVDHGVIDIDLMDLVWSIPKEKSLTRFFESFSDPYEADVPQICIPIFEKIVLSIVKEIDFSDNENDRLFLDFYAKEREISIRHYWNYIDDSNTEGVSYELESDENLKEVFESINEINNEGYEDFQLDYNGSGDSGYLESDFTNRLRVPEPVENWCYSELERNFGGWEINEGSSGFFLFDLKNKTVELNHTNNTEVEEEDTVFEESFDK